MIGTMTDHTPTVDSASRQTMVSSASASADLSRRAWLLAMVLIIATFAAYRPVWQAGFIWDDRIHVTHNVNLRSAAGLWRIWFEPEASQQYYPLQLSSYWLEFHLWGLHPLGYHLVNVLLHAGNAILLWQLLRRLQAPGAWLAAAVFAVHPVEVESVAWISERKNLLSGMFYLLALLAFLRCRPLTAATGENRKSDWQFYVLGLFLFVCALLSKTVACSLPAVMVLLIWWKRGRVEKRDVYALTPLFVIGAALGLTTAWLEKYHVGAAGTDWSLTFVQRCLLAGRALLFYASKLFWPHPLSFIYPRWEIDAHVWWQYLFPLSAAAVWITLWLLRQRIGKGPLVAVSAFAVMLFPALGFFDVYPFRFSFVADHFQYLASAGVIAVVASSGVMVCDRAGRLGRQMGEVAGPVILLSLAVLTWRQAHLYRDPETLWRDTLTKNPQCWMAHNNLGATLSLQRRVREAIQHLNEAVRIKPDYAEAQYNLGVVLMEEGRLQEAIGRFEQALRINPSYAKAHCDLGWALQQSGSIDEAIAEYHQALNIKPNLAEAHNDLGTILLQQGKVNDALIQCEDALRSDPDDAEAYYNAGLALVRLGRMQEAQQHWQRALQINPDYSEAHYSLGIISQQAGQTQDAIAHYEKALRGKPDYWEAHYNLALALGRTGNIREAEEHLEQALRIKPDFTQARDALARLQSVAGRPSR